VSDGDALLAAILREPADHTSRLVYADWLDERGEPGDAARAEFIRVQCERARIPEPEEITIFRDGGPVCKACQYVRGGSGLCRFHELFQRERELFNCLYADNLPGPFVPNLDGHTGRDGPHAQYRRGFVERVFNCAAADWLTHGDAITAAHPIRRVALTTEPGLEEFTIVVINPTHTYYRIAGKTVCVPLNSTAPEILAERWRGVTFTIEANQ
jgi:uncharacterized protein (TIGR02996 family)